MGAFEVCCVAGKLKGEVVAVGPDGSLVTDINRSQLDGVPRDESVTVACDGHKTLGIYESNHSQPEMTLLAVLNTEGQLEITLVGENAKAFLGIQTGSSVVVSWT